MKNKLLKPLLLLLSVVIIIILYIKIQQKKEWDKSEKRYAIAWVKGFIGGSGGARDKYEFTVDRIPVHNKQYNLKQKKHYIVTFLLNNLSKNSISIKYPINPNLLLPQPPEGWTECPINEDGTIKEKYKRSNDPWYLKKARYVVGEAMDTNMRYIYRFKWRYASVPNVEIGKHYMLKINADDLKQYELASTIPIDTTKLQIQTNGGWEECPVTKEGVIKDKFKK